MDNSLTRDLKLRVKAFWEAGACGSSDAANLQEGSREFFDEVERQRYSGIDRAMLRVVGFSDWNGKRVLEVGCGLGTDLLQFARGGAQVCGLDLTAKGAFLTRKRLKLYGFDGHTVVGDSESLPFQSNYFDLVYSWGVIHHTPDTGAAAREIMRVCRPGGRIIVMVYHRRSLLALQAWLFYGLLRGRPELSLRKIIAENIESPGTKTYTSREALELFHGIQNANIRTMVSRFDLRIGRRRFLPSWFKLFVPSQLGWFMIVNGAKYKPTSNQSFGI